MLVEKPSQRKGDVILYRDEMDLDHILLRYPVLWDLDAYDTVLWPASRRVRNIYMSRTGLRYFTINDFHTYAAAQSAQRATTATGKTIIL